MLRHLPALFCAALLTFLSVAQAQPASRGVITEIPDEMWARMVGVSWHEDLDCPPRDALVLLRIPFVDFYGDRHVGEMVVARQVAGELLDIFSELLQSGFPIQSMRPVHAFAGSDLLSMNANNTSAFNCRRVAGTTRMSQHARGWAIDINPVQNPYVKGSKVSPEAGELFDGLAERGPKVPGLITEEGPVVRAFKSRGWQWGGDWRTLKDYQHFSKSGG